MPQISPFVGLCLTRRTLSLTISGGERQNGYQRPTFVASLAGPADAAWRYRLVDDPDAPDQAMRRRVAIVGLVFVTVGVILAVAVVLRYLYQ